MKRDGTIMIIGIILVFVFLYFAASGYIPGIEPERSLLDQVREKVVCPQFPSDELDGIC